MKGIMKAVLLVVLLPAGVVAQEARLSYEATVPPFNARFEIVESPVSNFTIRLDRISGRTARLLTTGGEPEWVEMRIVGLPAIPGATTPRFQIFMSGTAFERMFLLDTETGSMWRTTFETGRSSGRPTSEVSWEPFRD